MRYDDPKRPKIGVEPSLIGKDGNGLHSIVPFLQLHPKNNGTLEFAVMLRVDFNTYRWHFASASDPTKTISCWLEDPEKLFEEEFGWKQPDGLKSFSKTQPNTLSLSDLDDLLKDL